MVLMGQENGVSTGKHPSTSVISLLIGKMLIMSASVKKTVKYISAGSQVLL